MSTINLTADKFEDTVLSDGIVLVDFWAEWCGPCKSFGPVFEASSEKHADITFAKVDTEAEQQLSGGLGIQSIPTIMAFRDGVQVFSQPGALPQAALEDLIGQIEALDMEAIHKEIADHDPRPRPRPRPRPQSLILPAGGRGLEPISCGGTEQRAGR